MTYTEKAIPGTWYTITCTAPVTVTQQIGGETAELATLSKSGTTSLRPSVSTITVETDGKYHLLPTKAPAAGSIGGGGSFALAEHTADTVAHVTAEERAAWNNIAAVKGSPNITLGSGSSSSTNYNIAIGYNATAVTDVNNDWAAGSIAIGLSANANVFRSVAIGPHAKCTGPYGTSVGLSTTAYTAALALGHYALASGDNAVALSGTATKRNSTALGAGTKAEANYTTAIGNSAIAKNAGIVAIAAWNDDATVQTTLYLMGAGSSIATTYEGGEACLGYVTKDTSGNVIAAGTRKLSELLTNNTTFAPAALDLDADPPKVFLPTGATDPIEWPESLEGGGAETTSTED